MKVERCVSTAGLIWPALRDRNEPFEGEIVAHDPRAINRGANEHGNGAHQAGKQRQHAQYGD